ncbi:MAG TPA: alpha/beta fold hydrolase [Anaerolineae bacterium]
MSRTLVRCRPLLLVLAASSLAACTGSPARGPSALVANFTPTAVTATATVPDPTAVAAVAPTETTAPPTLAPVSPTAAATALPATAALTETVPAVPSIVSPTATPAPQAGAAALTATPPAAFSTEPNPLQIEVMRKQFYPGSEIVVEQTLAPGANYGRQIVSYHSDGYKIEALMTTPNGPRPKTGWPVIVFNHGYIPPSVYRTTERYVAYVDAIARSGYIVFKSDYRGHGSSEGPTTGGGYGSPGYTDDVLNAVASLKAYKDADPNRIGMWGHSMGGQITLRAMVVSSDIKAGVIWGGVVAPYPDLLTKWTRLPGAAPEYIPSNQRRWRAELTAQYGSPDQNPAFWASISPNSYLKYLSGPLQLQASLTDEEVPILFSQTLYQELKDAGKPSELDTYPNDNHNMTASFNVAMARTIAWFDRYVKGA